MPIYRTSGKHLEALRNDDWENMFYDNVIDYHCTECAAQAIVVEQGAVLLPEVLVQIVYEGI